MSYAADHAGALADIQDAGTAVTFTTASGTYDPETDTYSSVGSATVTGFAIQTTGDPERYEQLGLVKANPATLFFVPGTLGAAPGLGATVTWAGSGRTVKSQDPVAPDGTAIAWRVVVA